MTRRVMAEHGTTNMYVNHGCRCAPCRAVWSAYSASKRYPHPTKPGVLVSRQRVCQVRNRARAAIAKVGGR